MKGGGWMSTAGTEKMTYTKKIVVRGFDEGPRTPCTEKRRSDIIL